MSPSISKAELDRVKNRQGLYNKLAESNDTLRKTTIRLVEMAFREYVKSHKGKHITKLLEDESWDRFKVILQKYL